MSIKKVSEIVNAFRIINSSKISKMEDEEKFSLVKIIRDLKKISDDFESLLKEAQTRLKPEGLDEIIAKYRNGGKLSNDEVMVIDGYDKAVAACVKDELNKEIEVTYEPMSSDAISRFIISNDFEVSDILAIADLLS